MHTQTHKKKKEKKETRKKGTIEPIVQLCV